MFELRIYFNSEFLRDFIEDGLVDYAKENPGVVVYVKPRRHRTPVIVAEYRKFSILNIYFLDIEFIFVFSKWRKTMDQLQKQH